MTTSRKCPQCGSEVSSTARFCPECGSSMTPAAAAAAGTPPGGSPAGPSVPNFGGSSSTSTTVGTEPRAENTQRTITGLLIAAVVLLSIMVAVLAATLRRTNVAAVQPCVSAPAPAPAAPAGAGEAHLPSAASISPSPAAPASETTGTSTSTSGSASTSTTAAPADAVDYLKYLQGIDQRRVSLLTGPPSGAVSAPASPDTPPADEWQSLISDFQSHSVPDAFSTFAGEYMTFLMDCQTATGKPADQLGSLATEAGKLDSDLNALCAKLKVVKPFTIAPPVAQPAQPAQPQLSAPPTSETPAPSTPPATPPGQP